MDSQEDYGLSAARIRCVRTEPGHQPTHDPAPSPDALDPRGVSRVQVSFERARDTGRPDPLSLGEVRHRTHWSTGQRHPVARHLVLRARRATVTHGGRSGQPEGLQHVVPTTAGKPPP